MHETINGLVASYGYALLVVLVGLESFGIPLPGETALVTAGAFAALGRLNIAGVIIAAAAGAILGDNAGYWLGRKGGIALIHRYGRHVGLDDAKVARVQSFFERHGAKTVFIGRFIALLRSWAAALAGVACMPYHTFTLYNALGGLTWAALFGSLGYAFGRNLPRLERYIGQASLVVVLLVALVVLLWLGARWFREHRDEISARVSAGWRRVANDPRFADFRQHHAKLWMFVAARFARGEYLGLHLTIGLLVSLAGLWLFGGITEDVIHHDPLTLLDLRLADWFRAHSTPVGVRIASVLSLVGSPVTMAVLAVVVALFLVRRRWWITLGGWLAAFAGGGVLDWMLKTIIHRPRPTGAAAFLHGNSFSFPSGHALGSLIGFGMLAYIVLAYWPASRKHIALVIVVAFALIVAIGLSRLYLGVHYFSDVVGGYAAGLVWLATCVSGIEVALRERKLSPWQVGVDQRPVAEQSAQ
jgi:undecaprenyl-diphosphatase